MAIQEQLPEQAPLDVIIGSREMFRGQIRSRRLVNVAKAAVFAVLFTFNASILSRGDLGVAKAHYWLLTTAGVVAGLLLGSVDALRRERSAQRQQKAIDDAWRSARGAVASARSGRRRWILVGLAVGIVIVIFFLAFTFSDLHHVFWWILPVFGLDAGMWMTKLLMTFRWATWFGAGAIDPDVAKQLVWAHNKALKVQRNAQAYAESQAHLGEQPA
jgi:hypothetical protein